MSSNSAPTARTECPSSLMSSDREQLEIFDRAEPVAASLAQSLRGLGYSLESAIADLLDNSISAGATNVWLTFEWSGSESVIMVEDNGFGMSEVRLVEAMRLGCMGPSAARQEDDLGRFGLGLKTASLSQCRRFTVCSWDKTGRHATRCWDLDVIEKHNDWLVLKRAFPETWVRVSNRRSAGSGTLVIWEHLDRLVGEARVEDEEAHARFLERVARVHRHLAMTFHRFLEEPGGLKLFVNGQSVEPWDPFLRREAATQALGQESLPFMGAVVEVRPYVLPHHSKLATRVHEEAAGLAGWNEHQGFFVYRGNRLLVAGDWLGLKFQKEEHAKLARIQLDIPNSLDEYWHIDVRKSRARPPVALVRDLRRIAEVTRKRAIEIYRHRGKVVIRSIKPADFVWQQRVKAGRTFYTINRAHPLVEELRREAAPVGQRVERVLRMIEETIPLPLIVLRTAERPDDIPGPFDGSAASEVAELARQVYRVLIASGLSSRDAAERLRNVEPFPYFPEVVEAVIAGQGPES